MILTVAIPTFRSRNSLERLLLSILSQSIDLSPDIVEIVISDNDPDSDLRNYVLSLFSGSNLIVHYYKNERNLGYDGNLLQLAKKANGKYIKFIADDDFLGRYFFERHLELINRTNPDIVINNFYTFRGNADEINDSSVLSEVLIYEPLWTIEKFNCLQGKFGQISSLTFKLSLIKEKIQPAESNYIHMYWLYSALEGAKIVYEQNPQIFVELGSPNFSENYLKIVNTSLQGLNAIKNAKFENRSLKRKILNLSQNYAFQVLRLFPELLVRDRVKVLKAFWKDFLVRPDRFLSYFPYVVLPTFLKRGLVKLLAMRKSN